MTRFKHPENIAASAGTRTKRSRKASRVELRGSLQVMGQFMYNGNPLSTPQIMSTAKLLAVVPLKEGDPLGDSLVVGIISPRTEQKSLKKSFVAYKAPDQFLFDASDSFFDQVAKLPEKLVKWRGVLLKKRASKPRRSTARKKSRP